jgi:hypothetical protein
MKKLFLILTAGLFALTACDKPVNGPQGGNEAKGTLEVTEKSVDIAFYGGEGVVNYTITDGEAGAKPTVTANQEWVNNITVADTITFNVDFNNIEEQRVATLNVKYGEQTFDVFVRQEAGMVVDVEFVATALNGEYFGTAYSEDPNYFAILSKNGTTGWSDLYLDTYYRFDIYSATPTDASAPVLPQGVFAYDYLNSGVGETFGDFYSVRMETFESGSYQETKIEDGVVIVTENKIEAILKMADGKVHRVVYEGSLALSYLEFPEPEYYSTLTEDYSFAHNDGVIRFFHYGDYYNIGASNWTIVAMLSGDPINGDYFMVDLNADKVSANCDDVVGTYTCVATEADVAHNTFTAGGMDGNNYTFSWFQFVVDNYIDHSRRAPIADGTVTVAKEGTGYLVTFDCMDDNGHKITGTFNCPTVEFYDRQEE